MTYPISDLIDTGQLTEYGNVIGLNREQVEDYLAHDPQWVNYAATVDWAIEPHPIEGPNGVWAYYGIGRSRAAG